MVAGASGGEAPTRWRIGGSLSGLCLRMRWCRVNAGSFGCACRSEAATAFAQEDSFSDLCLLQLGSIAIVPLSGVSVRAGGGRSCLARCPTSQSRDMGHPGLVGVDVLLVGVEYWEGGLAWLDVPHLRVEIWGTPVWWWLMPLLVESRSWRKAVSAWLDVPHLRIEIWGTPVWWSMSRSSELRY